MSQPVQYKNGHIDFFGRTFVTDVRALIPRFETEFLVKKTIEWCSQNNPHREWSIVDIGTGSGVIAISLVLEMPTAKITAIDISSAALSLARENALRYGLEDRIQFINDNLLNNFSDKIDVIVANLPYLPTERISRLDSSVRDFEPHQALDGGTDGFKIYRRLLSQIANHIANHNLKPKLCVFEFDEGQEQIAKKAIKHYLPKTKIEILRDSSILTRYIVLEL